MALSQDDIVSTAANTGAHYIATLISAWDKSDVNDLHAMVAALYEFCEVNGLEAETLVDVTDLPSADIPDDVDTSYPVWAMDINDNLLVGETLDTVMTLAEYREAVREAKE